MRTQPGQANFIGYPTHQVFAVLDRPEDLAGALGALEAAELAPEVFSGDEGVRRIDASGQAHGLRGRLVRTFQLLGDEAEHARRYEHQLKTGHFVVSVKVTSSAQKKQVAALIREHGGYFVNYYGPWASENL